ncbi:MAG: nitroreductase/quinone reductase family protein [Nakamurella sp.]
MRDLRAMNQQIIEKFRAGADMGGMPRDRMLLLTTTGRRSGLPRTAPMMFTRVNGTLVVVASNSGAARDPDWYRNLVADPAVTVEIGDEHFAATARPAKDPERAAVWASVIGQIPMYVQHQQSTKREIPLVELIADTPHAE